MPTISFAQRIRNHVEVEPCEASGATVSVVLEAVFCEPRAPLQLPAR
jgi:hypothetical protein